MKRIVALLVLGLLVGCASETKTESPAASSATIASRPPTTPTPCVSAPRAAADAVAEGMNGGATLGNAEAITVPKAKRNTGGFPELLLAARITGPSVPPDTIGVWAVGSADGGGPLWALDEDAQKYSEWLAGAAEGSQADQNRDLVASYEEARAVEACAES